MKEWRLYILICKDDTLYTGISKNVERRVTEHNNSKRGAKYTRHRRPVSLVYISKNMTKSLACKEEYRIKRMTRLQKLNFLNHESNCL